MRADLLLAAQRQAHDRAGRDGVTCYVYRKGETWFVRSYAEGAPEGAVLEYVAEPPKGGVEPPFDSEN